MSRALSTLIACVVAVLVAGCGSSSSSSSPGQTTTSPSTAATNHGGVKFGGKPNFATPSSSEAVHAGTVQVAYHNISIHPDTLRVKVGTTVVWTNFDSVEHTVTSEGGPQQFASGTFGEGRSFRVTFTKPGVVHYECTIHPTSMNGTIEVVK